MWDLVPQLINDSDPRISFDTATDGKKINVISLKKLKKKLVWPYRNNCGPEYGITLR